MQEIDITYPEDFSEKVKETLRTKIGIEPPTMSQEEYIRLSESERRIQDRKVDIYRDWFATLMYARQTGYRQGLKINVKELLKNGLTLEQISSIVKQSVEQLEYLLNTTDEEDD